MKYQFKLDKKEKWKLNFGVGFGVMNTGTGFTYPLFENKYDSTGQPIYTSVDDTFLFWAPRCSVGVSFKKYTLVISAHKSKNQYNNNLFALWIETKLGYKINL